MKKVLTLSTCAVMVVLMSSCSLLPRSPIPETVSIGGVTYRNGFYGYLWPQNLHRTGDSYSVNGIEYYHIQNKEFNWVHSLVGPYTCGVLYCAENEWDDAQLYYGNPDNYNFYCKVETANSDPYTINIDSFDSQKFDELVDFQNENEYIPFNNTHNEKIFTIRLPMPDWNLSPQLVFYKESLDGYFISFMGSKCHIIDGQLYLVYQYDYGHGEYEELICVQAPKQLSKYILRLADEYGFSYESNL